jgi:hypothetical protein
MPEPQIFLSFLIKLARTARRLRIRVACLRAVVCLLLCAPTHAQEGAGLPVLHANEEFIGDVTARTALDTSDLRSVLAYVLAELPARVKVFPTENYYYFFFYQGGVRWAGNFRFDVDERDKGFVEFVYFRDTTDWIEDEEEHHATLGAEHGVVLTKVRDLVYELSFAGRTVTFELNDLSDVRPPQGSTRAGEIFLGPVADESGVRFFLTFDAEAKMFHYVLDETIPVADELLAADGFENIVIGRRTAFAFFNDTAYDRKLLVGVYAPNVDLNNYLDGPFDQLPDNFLEGDELRDALLAAYPDIEGPIDRLGISPGGEVRQAIVPYLEYGAVEELKDAEKCAAQPDDAARYQCLKTLAEVPP